MYLTLAVVAGLCSMSFALQGGLTQDFQNFLKKHSKYSGHVDKFMRSDLGSSGSYGGKTSAGQQIKNQPIIFIHGNSDMALNPGGFNPYQTGWTKSIEYFMGKGYTSAEMYATTWGPAQAMEAGNQIHSCDYLQDLRLFVEAVLDYTKADKVDVITHSMGVTLGRKVLKGGNVAGDSCNLGEPLTDKVDSFIGLAGGNYGLTSCYYSSMFLQTCNAKNGFYPGSCSMLFFCSSQDQITGLSSYLQDINTDGVKEAQHVYYMYSKMDEIIGFGDIVWGNPTSRIPNADGSRVSDTNLHMQMKDNTGDWQYDAIVNHNTSS